MTKKQKVLIAHLLFLIFPMNKSVAITAEWDAFLDLLLDPAPGVTMVHHG
jgi:hypothetical protein